MDIPAILGPSDKQNLASYWLLFLKVPFETRTFYGVMLQLFFCPPII